MKLIWVWLLGCIALLTAVPQDNNFGSTSIDAEVRRYVDALIASIGIIEDTDTPTADKLKEIIAHIYNPNFILTPRELVNLKDQATQAISFFKNYVDNTNFGASAISERLRGQNGESAQKLQATSQRIATYTAGISASLQNTITAIQAAANQEEFKIALNPRNLYQSMTTVESVINSSKAELRNIYFSINPSISTKH